MPGFRSAGTFGPAVKNLPGEGQAFQLIGYRK
jgi:hypothetical protein